MKRILCLPLLLAAPVLAADEPVKLANPRAVAVGLGGKVFVGLAGAPGKAGDGAIVILAKDKIVPFVEGLDDPSALVAFQDKLYAIDGKRILRVDGKGKLDTFVDKFPVEPAGLDGLTVDVEQGFLSATDAKGGRIYRIEPKKGTAEVLIEKHAGLTSPAGIVTDGVAHVLVTDAKTGDLYRVNVSKKSVEKLTGGLGSADSLCWDKFGRLFVADRAGKQILVIAREGARPVKMADAAAPGRIALAPGGAELLVPDTGKQTIETAMIRVPSAEVDATPLPVETTLAFADLKWTGWEGVSPAGKVVPLRPILLTHAGDGSNRVFVPTQHGVIHVFPDDDKAKETKVFLDIQDRVSYNDNTNEEGFLGLTFPPKYKETGDFYVFYTLKSEKLVNVLSRFRVSKDDPNKADPKSEEILMKIKRPFWNHDGGTILFGPDGFLYVTLGDGGAGGDPFKNGQNLKTLLGKVLRIDVSRKEGDKPYAIPPDNPFVKTKDAAPEIWAYGFRNLWRMSFDRQTGKLWAGEVGQNLFEEINIIERGGNYGWKLRESWHPYDSESVSKRDDLIDPIWEYHHDIGKSITGGNVYRGKAVPELQGAYLYADYVSGRIWALWYDEKEKRVVANRPVKDRSLPILSFGEDEKGEVYLMTHTATGKGIYRFQKLSK